VSNAVYDGFDAKLQVLITEASVVSAGRRKLKTKIFVLQQKASSVEDRDICHRCGA